MKEKKKKYEFDFDRRKHLHVKLYTETKKHMREVADELGLSLQEIFERLAYAIINRDEHLFKILNDYKKLKEENKKFENLSEEDLFEMMKEDDPFGEK